MNKTRKDYLLTVLNKEIESKKTRAETARDIAREYGKHTASGWSVSGDRAHAEYNERLQNLLLGQLEKIKSEVEKSTEENPSSAGPPCFVKIRIDTTNSSQEFYFLSSNARLPGMSLLTPDSLLGKAIKSKRRGEIFSYTARDQEIRGKILAIE